MKKYLCLLLLCLSVFYPSGCAESSASDTFPGKIGIISINYDVGTNDETDAAARMIKDKYGEDKVVHVTWWDSMGLGSRQDRIDKIRHITDDPEVKAVVLAEYLPDITDALDNLIETRDDIFIVSASSQENGTDDLKRADVILDYDYFGTGPAMVEQAHKMGAKTFVYYSPPHPYGNDPSSFNKEREIALNRRIYAHLELAKEKSAELGMKFIAMNPSPSVQSIYDHVSSEAVHAAYEDVRTKVAEHGVDTAFFVTGYPSSLRESLMLAVISAGAVYPHSASLLSSASSPFEGVPEALGINPWDLGTYRFPYEIYEKPELVISETAKVLKAKGMLNRVFTWPKPYSMLSTVACAEYAIKRLKGEVPKEGIDIQALKECMHDYAGVECFAEPYEEDGVEYPNYLMVREGYLSYSENVIIPSAQGKKSFLLDDDFWVENDSGKTMLKRYIGFSDDIIIPDGITSIEYKAFALRAMRTVKIPDGVTFIGKMAFFHCLNLQSVTIPNSVVYIEDDAFTAYLPINNYPVTILCKKGSSAERYALEKRINVEIIQ